MDCKSMVESVMILATAAGPEHATAATELVIALVKLHMKRARQGDEEGGRSKRGRLSTEIQDAQIEDEDETQI